MLRRSKAQAAAEAFTSTSDYALVDAYATELDKTNLVFRSISGENRPGAGLSISRLLDLANENEHEVETDEASAGATPTS